MFNTWNEIWNLTVFISSTHCFALPWHISSQHWKWLDIASFPLPTPPPPPKKKNKWTRHSRNKDGITSEGKKAQNLFLLFSSDWCSPQSDWKHWTICQNYFPKYAASFEPCSPLLKAFLPLGLDPDVELAWMVLRSACVVDRNLASFIPVSVVNSKNWRKKKKKREKGKLGKFLWLPGTGLGLVVGWWQTVGRSGASQPKAGARRSTDRKLSEALDSPLFVQHIDGKSQEKLVNSQSIYVGVILVLWWV